MLVRQLNSKSAGSLAFDTRPEFEPLGATNTELVSHAFVISQIFHTSLAGSVEGDCELTNTTASQPEAHARALDGSDDG